ncbi:linear amide C-N hydrolase [Paenibacillaceae sp. P-4]|uniref:linear amide C-N hydrolase n=1 Tax=Paenibacillaceae bacterium P-4 TaxID=3160969 RepID=UPI0032E82590
MSTTVYMNQTGVRLLGKNQDVPYDGAYLFTNHRGIAKSALVMPPNRPMEWVSKYGSITISQVGKEMPNGGMNEAGLVVEQTTFWQSSYPHDQNQPAIGELQWIQLMLDTCASVQEVKDKAGRVMIVNPTSRLHYMACDQIGGCAIFEFANGVLSIYEGEELPMPVMANTSYPKAIRDWKDYDGKWRMDYGDYEQNSMERFIRAASYLDRQVAEMGFAFDVLQAIQREDTAFSLVYDINNLEIHFTSNRYPDRKMVSLKDTDFSRDDPMALNLQRTGEGGFVPYSTDLNRTVAEAFFLHPVLTAVFGMTINEEMIVFMAAFPDSFKLVKNSTPLDSTT